MLTGRMRLRCWFIAGGLPIAELARCTASGTW